MKAAIIFGSKSDTDKMRGAAKCFKEFGVEYEAYVLSAHRVPERLVEVLKDLEERGFEAIVAGAGLAAHLPGVIASKTTLPVIGVPLEAALDGMDALLSIVQMPKSIPVATVGINNSYNGAMVAVQILSVKYPEIKEKLVNFRKEMKENFLRDNGEVVEL
ncbi:5-(carboxyamino)imidazole ribonucleotide mutase [Spirochaeta isovalerica]|uniref:N5-carboxyaminoimidazole ribonucleotide mutase n=1 Tax=Spirochaeta isovalerica TaxID=150 RepID=A0A841R442_9SPIO|nr:5-(carboxyamino)imidazole ribonucleotide mutase [Spirochaeta isovalerica]MBB6478635.1 5-(carboxyamino)imidazole ribonucleotide mutase [Spirochaeta isovalerica]